MEGKDKIVVIDDEKDLCKALKENLEDTEEFEVATTSRPEKAEIFILKEKPDLIILDLVMPRRRGDKIIKVLKLCKETKRIPIIIISGKGEMVYSRRIKKFQWRPNTRAVRNRGKLIDEKNPQLLAKAYGVLAYISKPFKTDILLKVVRNTLKKSKKRMVRKGRVVRFHYTIRFSGQDIHTSEGKKLLEFTYGEKWFVPRFSTQLCGLHVGDKKTIIIKPKVAYHFVDPHSFKGVALPVHNDPRAGKFEFVVTILEIE